MIQPWLKEVQVALHDKELANASIDGKLREIRTFHDGIKSVKVGEFTFITQNPAKTTEWAKSAREGKKVTQVKKGDAWYGVIVDDKVMRYQGHGKEPIVVGYLPTVEEGQVKLTEADEIPLSTYELSSFWEEPQASVEKDPGTAFADKLLEGPIEAGQTPDMTLPEVVETLLHGIRTGQITGDKLGETKDLLVSALESHLERAL